MSQLKRIESAYGDLQVAFERDGLESILATHTFSLEDQAAGKPNPSKTEIQGKSLYSGLVHLRGALNRYKRFLSGQSQEPTWPALNEMRRTFLEKCHDFESFDQREGLYFDNERSYKDALIKEAATILKGTKSPDELGRMFLELMSPARSNFVGWRTFDAIKSNPDGFSAIASAIGQMVLADEDPENAIATAAAKVEPILRGGAQGKAVFGGLRSLLTCA